MMNRQQALDAHLEPQSMTYLWDGLKPTGSLVVREKAFDQIAPNFFTTGTRLLDVGCAKGYYSFKAAKAGLHATGIDYDANAISLCDNLRDPANQQLVFGNVSFRDKPLTDAYYDRIFMGNGPHYMFVGSGGNWDWIDKLAVLSTDLVLMEGGFNLEDPQMGSLVTGAAIARFNWHSFEKKVKEYFHILRKKPSPVTGRYIVLLKKRQDLSTFREVQLYDLPIDHTFRLGWKEHSTLFLTRFLIEDSDPDEPTMSIPKFAKLYPIGCRPQTTQLASLFPGSSDIEAVIKFGDQYAGVCEPYYTHPEWGALDFMPELIKISCEQQIFLAKQGHIDIDVNLGNVMYRRGFGCKIVDKNQIYPIKPLDDRHAKLWRETLQNPELGLDPKLPQQVTDAIIACDSWLVEQAFRNVRNAL
jgi:SAM-dependent methyltransferase